MIKNRVYIEYGDVSSCAVPIGSPDKPAYVELLIKPQKASVLVSWGSDEVGLIPHSHEMATGHVLVTRSYASGFAAIKIERVRAFMQSATRDLQRVADGHRIAPTGVIELNDDATDAWNAVIAGFMSLKWSTAVDPEKTPEAIEKKQVADFMNGLNSELPKKGDADYMCPHNVALRILEKHDQKAIRLSRLLNRRLPASAPKGPDFEDLCLDITKQVFKALSHEFQRPMYRRNGHETRLEPTLFAKIEAYVGRLIDTAVSTKKFRESYILLDIMRDNPQIMEQASELENVSLGPGAIEKLMHANVASAVRSRLSTQKIALHSHKRALKLGY